jgi:hypothetical protein
MEETGVEQQRAACDPSTFEIADRDLIAETRNQKVWNSMNNYFIRIHRIMLFKNALYYWQHNKLTVTEKYADVIQFFRQ